MESNPMQAVRALDTALAPFTPAARMSACSALLGRYLAAIEAEQRDICRVLVLEYIDRHMADELIGEPMGSG